MGRCFGRPENRRCQREEADESCAEGNSERQIRQRLGQGIRDRLQEIQRAVEEGAKSRDRKSRRAFARLDAVDAETLNQRRAGCVLILKNVAARVPQERGLFCFGNLYFPQL